MFSIFAAQGQRNMLLISSLICYLTEPEISWQDFTRFGICGKTSFVNCFDTAILAVLVLRSGKENAIEANHKMKSVFITAISSLFWEYKSWGTFEELYEAVMADTAICFHIWDSFHTTALCSFRFLPCISIMHCTLLLMSYSDEGIRVLQPLDRIISGSLK